MGACSLPCDHSPQLRRYPMSSQARRSGTGSVIPGYLRILWSLAWRNVGTQLADSSMPLRRKLRRALRTSFEAPLRATLRRRTVEEPWDEAAERLQRPFHYALVPAAVWKGSKFERSFTTSLGSVWERAAVAIGVGSPWLGTARICVPGRDSLRSTPRHSDDPQRPRGASSPSRLGRGT